MKKCIMISGYEGIITADEVFRNGSKLTAKVKYMSFYCATDLVLGDVVLSARKVDDGSELIINMDRVVEMWNEPKED